MLVCSLGLFDLRFATSGAHYVDSMFFANFR